MKSTRKLVIGVSVVCFTAPLGASLASAHEHELITPNGNQVALPCEPFHGTTPGQSQHSKVWDETRGLHPIHWGLHKGPSEDTRNITVRVSDDGC